MKRSDPPVPRSAVRIRGGLPRVGRLLRARRPLGVGYLGGSITEGAGASDPAQTSWRAGVTRWFSARHPDAAIHEICAGWGGTGSALGAFRCAHELVPAAPDLVLVEFAVNDHSALDPSVVARAMEGIVRQLRRRLPGVEILFVYCTSRHMDPEQGSDGPPPVIRVHEEVAEHYGLPSVDVGRALRRSVAEGELDWAAALPDGTHPGDAGHAIYARTIGAALPALLATADAGADPLPAPIHPDSLENGYMVPVEQWPAAQGWLREVAPRGERLPTRLCCSEGGKPLVFEFTGQAVGLTYVIAADSGNLRWSIDGGPMQNLVTWDHHARNFSRAHYCLLASRLVPGKHRLELQATAEQPPESSGRIIRLGGLLVDGLSATHSFTHA